MVRETEISLQFGFVIYEVIPMKGVYQLKTNMGNKCLKKLNYGAQKMMYIYKAKEHIINNGFNRIDQNMLTIEGLPYAFVNDDIYAVSEWIEGRECNFRIDDDLLKAAYTLGEFHNSARGFIPVDMVARSDIGKLNATLQKRLKTLNKMRDMARRKRRKTQFDMMYLSNVDYYIELSQDALNVLDMESYARVCLKAEENKVLCHHDYTYHNILFEEDGTSHIVDFDYCKAEVQVYDIATLIGKSLKRLNWEKSYATEILDSYREAAELDEDDLNVLKSILTFPQRFWRLANRYYYKEPGWSEDAFTKKMKEILDEKTLYVEFVNSLGDILK